jgi:hypothetical protein
VGHADAGPFHEQVRYDRAVAGGVVALEAEQAAASPGREGCQAREVLLRGLGGHVLGEDAVQLGPVSGARGDPARLRGAESAEVDVADAARIERGGQQGLGEAGLAGLRDGADVDQKLDLVGEQAAQGAVEGLCLVACGEEVARPVCLAVVRRAQMCLPMRPTM